VAPRHRAGRRRAAWADRPLPRTVRLPHGPARAALAGCPGRLRVLDGPRDVAYRRLNDMSDGWGTAVDVQQMVFGDLGARSGSGSPSRATRSRRRPSRAAASWSTRRARTSCPAWRTARPLRARRMAAGRASETVRDPSDARATRRRHAGHGVHGRAGRLYMLRRAAPSDTPVQPCASPWTPWRRRCSRGGRRSPRSTPARWMPAASRVRPGRPLRGRRPRRGRVPRGGARRHCLHRRRGGPGRRGEAGRHPCPSVHRGRRCGRVLRREAHPDAGGRQGRARRAGYGPAGGHGRRGGRRRSAGRRLRQVRRRSRVDPVLPSRRARRREPLAVSRPHRACAAAQAAIAKG
jgi:hypothetical protein